jgi:acyl-CoA synthetase (NDP forming)
MNSPDVTHKSDAGGVFLDVDDDVGIRAAFRAIRAAEGRHGARAGGALVCAMAPAGHEVIVGVTKDPQFGHAVMFGLGGIFVEVMKDVSFRVAPLSEKDAAEMIREIRGYRALTGLRGKPAGDLDALRMLLMQLSAFLAAHPEIEEMDLNPVIVHPRGLSIADARVVLRAEGTTARKSNQREGPAESPQEGGRSEVKRSRAGSSHGEPRTEPRPPRRRSRKGGP